MRPRVLTVSAFGPYAGTEVIDFRPVQGKDLLLIEGPIGAGKTAILDAMTFALFGVVPGARDQVRSELKSAWADPQARCEVRLEFELGDKVYMAVRAPAQTRAKKRGGGVTQERAEAKLFFLDGDRPVPICPARVGDVDAEVTRLLGLDAEQFKQVLLLPQGEFRRFLLASSTEKETLLEHLFGTGVYKRATELLADEKLRLERRLGELERARSDLLGARGALTPEALDDMLASLRDRLGGARRAAGEARGEAARARGEAARAEALARSFAERDRLSTERATLAQRAAAVDASRRLLAALDRALPLLPLLGAADTAAAALARRTASAERRRQAREIAAAEVERAAAAAEAAPGLRERAESLAAEERSLAEVAALIEELSEAAGKVATLGGVAQKAAARTVELDGRIAAAERELAALEQRLAGAQAAAVEEAELAARAAAVATVARDRAGLAIEEAAAAQLAGRAAELATQRQAAAARRVAAQRALDAARAAREAGLAGELAAGLRPGAACPVCGSEEHPAPARPAASGAAASAEVIRRGGERLAALDGELTALERQGGEAAAGAEAHAERATELRGLLGVAAERAVEELAAETRALAEQATAARRAAGQRGALSAARERTATALATLRGERERAATAQAAAELERGIGRARLDDLRARVAAAVDGDPATVPARRGELARQRAAALESAAALERRLGLAREAATAEERLAGEAARQADEARLAAADAEADLGRGLRAAGFAGAADASAVLAERDRRDAARAEIEAYDAARVSVAARLDALERELDGKPPPDATALAAAAGHAETEAERLATEVGRLMASLAEAERARARLAELGEEVATLDARLATFGRVARVAAGDNAMRMSLARFVLAQRIDEVAVAASQRLLRLSRGRYVLRRSDDVRHAGRGSGLDLVVEDRMTGVDRSVQTLSNGEQFLASLSLAMGLADTVQAHAGGVRLDSLFIDEGFGSLDDEALDLVVRVLEDLRAGGRLVGIITHVAELRERLTTRISVRKGPRGSSTSLVV